MKAPVYNLQGEAKKEVELSADVFSRPVNDNLLYQVYTSMLSNNRKPLAFSKDRSEVSGGGKKPWRQKGTGRARHGSIRSPLWKGGGATFGPRSKEENWHKKVNKKVKKSALQMALSQKLKEGEIKIIEDLNLQEGKTKQMDQFFRTLLQAKKKVPTVLFLLDGKDEILKKSVRNLPYLKAAGVDNVDLMDILNRKYLVMTESVLPAIEKIIK